MLTSLLIVQTIKKFVKNKVFLKWPNDIFIDNKKVGGVLVENNIENNNNYCLIGVGINFLSSPVLKYNYETTFLKKYNKFLKIDVFLIKLLNNFIANYNIWKISKRNLFINEYKNSLMFLNKEVLIKLNNNILLKGKFIDITKEGYLIILSNDKKKVITSGSMELIK